MKIVKGKKFLIKFIKSRSKNQTKKTELFLEEQFHQRIKKFIELPKQFVIFLKVDNLQSMFLSMLIIKKKF